MEQSTLYQLLKKRFPFDPTVRQEMALSALSEFATERTPRTTLLIKGYAGTGKTTLIGTLVTDLWKSQMSSVLLAPTGRAAKVVSNYSGKQAFTIHKKIYRPLSKKEGGVKFKLQTNKHRNTLFIVDEASMIPDVNQEGRMMDSGALLDDLIQYVFQGYNCKLLLVGDTAQLPPVKLSISPALDEDLLEKRYDLNIKSIELTEVVRQEEGSGILSNATHLRENFRQGFFNHFHFRLRSFTDIHRPLDSQELLDAIEDSYARNGKEDTAFIVRSNKRANQYNQQIRNRILYQQEEINTGDYLMVVKNNYFWLEDGSSAGFIANGDIVEILRVFDIVEKHGFRFAEVEVRMVDYPDVAPMETVLLLDTLDSAYASLTQEQSNELYQQVRASYADIKTNYKRFLAVKNDRFFNALQVKFAYAMTCHKSQGGQWNTVFVEQPFLPDGINKEYLRWLYTAVTRAQKSLYLIGFPEDFFAETD
ncbi:ATP-dependent DNA helicase [Aureitalea marina]|uniref:ATP-dependent endonuclease n=1 Tax=Aureitalea marina TaxID=930804 RepID=A0A2S7KNW1_9FLAO|nr:AAA family ATPase [Aureitalea marina]PQB04312.1 ATP-dependent endonuclease [Aureitalea marina]